MTDDEHNAQLAFTAARAEQEKKVQAQPDYGPAWCVLGVIDAALGRKEEALREGRRAVELLPVEKDSINFECCTHPPFVDGHTRSHAVASSHSVHRDRSRS